LFVIVPLLAPYPVQGQEQKLSTVEIKRLITGKAVTDEVHYTDYFRPGGAYEGVFMNKRLTGSWKVKDGRLCITRGSDPETCDEFWRVGDKLQRRKSGLPSIRDNVIVRSK
jgi:hypothetical protein